MQSAIYVEFPPLVDLELNPMNSLLHNIQSQTMSTGLQGSLITAMSFRPWTALVLHDRQQ